MINAYVNYWKNFANFSGRARRADYWWPVLCQTIIGTILGIVMMVSLIAAIADGGGGIVGLISGLLVTVFCLASVVPTLSVSVRRLHDIGKSGWWYLIAFVPAVGGIILLVFMCTVGTSGDNQFGQDPKALV